MEICQLDRTHGIQNWPSLRDFNHLPALPEPSCQDQPPCFRHSHGRTVAIRAMQSNGPSGSMVETDRRWTTQSPWNASNQPAEQLLKALPSRPQMQLSAATPLSLILRFTISNSLPLHVAGHIGASAFERRHVIDNVARASPGGLPSRWARLRPHEGILLALTPFDSAMTVATHSRVGKVTNRHVVSTVRRSCAPRRRDTSARGRLYTSAR
jgi:hypothetical protein